MEIVTIRNVVFDIGNVLVKWSPEEIIRKTFGEEADTEKLIEKIFRNECWIALNKGELSEESAKQKYQRILYSVQNETRSLPLDPCGRKTVGLKLHAV